MRRRRRTRRHRRKIFSLNKIAFFCVILSIAIVCGVFLTPQKPLNKTEEQTVQTVNSEEIETETVKTDAEKNKAEIKNVSNIFPSVYSDITNAETKAKETLSDISNDGAIISEDYSSKNATSAIGSLYLRNTTKNTDINIEAYLKKDIFANINKDKTQPVVLVYHTHSTESYQITENEFYSNSLVADSETLGIIRVGDALCSTIESYGYKVIHDKTVYDSSYNGAFDRSREKISDILRANPSIQIVIDLHRDGISRKDGSKVKTVTEIDGKKVAQIQITTGCEDGAVTKFPNWEKNLTFALHLQKSLSDSYPHIARPLLFCARKYNMDLTPCAVNIDIGTESNTVREAVYSAEILGKSIVEIIKECENQ
ncbi:MAG: stage II sporulation protein P [Oscillospiraceae bacterium]|nr:stage II sporulation protein P [Oscillospiraceae bacterium]